MRFKIRRFESEEDTNRINKSVLKLFKAGHSLEDIRKHYKLRMRRVLAIVSQKYDLTERTSIFTVSKPVVTVKLKKANSRKSPVASRNQERNHEILRLHYIGYTMREIAKKFNITFQRVQQIIADQKS